MRPPQPNLRPTLAVSSPLRKLMEQFQTLEVDFTFREDGLHMVITGIHPPRHK